LKEKIDIKKIDQLNRRASKIFDLKKVYLNENFFGDVIKFIKKQNLLPFHHITKLLHLSGNKKFPIGIAMINKENKQIAGFVGTYFSNRSSKNENIIVCNIHSWIVIKSFRLYSYYLISDFLKKDISLTAFTPVESLKGLLLKLGFKKFSIKEYFIINTNFFYSKKNKFSVLSNIDETLLNLDEKKNYILKNYLDDIYLKIILKDDLGESILIIGTKVKKRGLNIFKLLYISNMKLFEKNYKVILNIISRTFKVFLISKYFMNNEDIFFFKKKYIGFSKTRDLYCKNIHQIENYDILNSDLIL